MKSKLTQVAIYSLNPERDHNMLPHQNLFCASYQGLFKPEELNLYGFESNRFA